MSTRRGWVVTGALGAVAVIGGSIVSATADEPAAGAGAGIVVAAPRDEATPLSSPDARATDPASPTAGSAVSAQTAVSAQSAPTPPSPASAQSPATPPSPASAQSPASAPSPASADSAD